MAKQKKTTVPELISLSELARRAGVSRAAVTSWILAQEAAGIHLTQPSGRRGKIVNANNPLIMRYINNVTDKSNRPGQDNKNSNKSPDTLRKLEHQAEKLRLQNIALHEKYIETEVVFNILEKWLEIDTEVFKGFSDRVLDRIEKELDCVITPESREKARQYMEQAIEGAHTTSCRIVENFKKKNKPRF